MAPQILVPENPLNATDVMQEVEPAGFDVVLARAGSAEWNAALPETDYLVGLGEVKMDDAFYKSARKLKLVQLLSAGRHGSISRRRGVPVFPSVTTAARTR